MEYSREEITLESLNENIKSLFEIANNLAIMCTENDRQVKTLIGLLNRNIDNKMLKKE